MDVKDKENSEKTIKRETVPYTNRDERFIVESANFENQYYALYCQRFNTLRPIVEKNARKQWIKNKMVDESLPILHRILDVEPQQSCIMIGTLVKQIKLLPSVLQLYTKEVGAFLDFGPKIIINGSLFPASNCSCSS